MIKLSGIFPPLTTPFDKDENLAVDKLKANITTLNRYNLGGYLVLGSNGESVMLSFEEKLRVFEAARQAIPAGKLMLAGTGAESTRETIALSKAAAHAGADAAVVLNPFYFKGQMKSEALVKHYFEVADASTIPVIIYNMPSNTGLDMDATAIINISSHPNISGLKDSGGNIVKMGEIIRQAKSGFRVMAGSAGFLLPALLMGAAGGILALANIAPAQCLKIYNSYQAGEYNKARLIQYKMIPINAAVTAQWGVPALKMAMDHLGIYGGPPRSPLMKANKHLKQIILSLTGDLPRFEI